MNRGWRYEGWRHYLAAKGVKTGRVSKRQYYAYVPTYTAGDIPAIGADAVGTAGVTAVELLPLAVLAGAAYVGVKGFKKAKESGEGKKTYKSTNIAAYDAARYNERLPGGKAEGLGPQHFDPVQLDKGEKVELEHTTDKQIAREVAMDHLSENPNYYKELEKIERKDPGLVARANGVPIYASKLDEGYIYPITANDAKKTLEAQGESTKGLKAVKFVMPNDKQQRQAYAQYVRSKREILIFAQKKNGTKVSGMDANRVRKIVKGYVIPHETGHHVALKNLPTDKDLKVAEARADAHAAGMRVNDRDVKMFAR